MNIAALLGAAVSLHAQGAGREPDTEPVPAEIVPLFAAGLYTDAVGTSGAVVAVGERGHIARSDDQAQSWSQQGSPVSTMLNAVTLAPGGRLWAVGHDAVILSSEDDGLTWNLRHRNAGDDPLFDVLFLNTQHGIAVGAYGLFLETRNGGETWEYRELLEEGPHYYTLIQGRDGTLFMAGEFGTIIQSTDQGLSWEPLPSPYRGTLFGILETESGALLIYGLRGHVYRSLDRGAGWSPVATGTETGILDAVSFGSRVVLAGLSGTVLESSDDGATFSDRSLANRAGLSALFEAGDTLWGCGEAGFVSLGNRP